MEQHAKEYFDFIKRLETDPEFCLEYIQQNPNHQQCLKTISQSAEYSWLYAKHVIKGRFALGEPTIIKDPKFACEYAIYILHTRWPEAEEFIAQSGEYATRYAQGVIHGQFKTGEHSISQDGVYSIEYARIIKKRFELGEPAIAKSAECSFLYAKDVIKQRFELGEPAIATNKELMLRYALEVIKGKLPEEMHNKMIGAALAA